MLNQDPRVREEKLRKDGRVQEYYLNSNLSWNSVRFPLYFVSSREAHLILLLTVTSITMLTLPFKGDHLCMIQEGDEEDNKNDQG